jgi:hypothetical protein
MIIGVTTDGLSLLLPSHTDAKITSMEDVTRTTLPDGRTLKTERGRKSAGQVLRFTVLMPTGRVVGVAEIQIPLIEGFSLAEKVGPANARAIEDDLKAVVVRVADAVQA